MDTKKSIILFAVLILLANVVYAGMYEKGEVKITTEKYSNGVVIEKRIVDVDKNLYINYDGAYKESFPNGMVPGFGSGLTLKSVKDNGDLEFYALTDRGPNGDGPNYKDGKDEAPAKIFPCPDFTPQIGILTVDKNKAEIKEIIKIKDKNGKNISGLPLKPGDLGSTNEIPISDKLEKMIYDNNGLDTEGIAIDKDGNIWICDEYGPFVLKLDPNGKILEKYEAGNGLPELLKYRHPNRGMEALTITPNGKVYVAVQSTLAITKKTRKTAQFLRIIEIDPMTKKTRTLGYPLDVEAYKSNKDAKLGDMYAISNEKIVIVEQGTGKNGKRNVIHLMDISKATDITNVKFEGKELEYLADISKLKDVKFITKEKIMDLRDYGWTPEKAEGLVVLDDMQTIVVLNDNDFGMETVASNSKNEFVDITEYTMNSDKSFTNSKGEKEELKIITKVTDAKLNLWFVKLPNKLFK